MSSGGGRGHGEIAGGRKDGGAGEFCVVIGSGLKRTRYSQSWGRGRGGGGLFICCFPWSFNH